MHVQQVKCLPGSATVYRNEVCSDGIKPTLRSNWNFSQIKRDISIQVSLRGTPVSEPNVIEVRILYQTTRNWWSLSYCELQIFLCSLKHSLMSLGNTTNHFNLTLFRSVERVNQTALVPLKVYWFLFDLSFYWTLLQNDEMLRSSLMLVFPLLPLFNLFQSSYAFYVGFQQLALSR